MNLTWDNDGDFDVNVYDADNKLLGRSDDSLQDRVETVTLKGVAQCTDLRVEVVNALAPPALTMTLDINRLGGHPSELAHTVRRCQMDGKRS